MKENCSLTTIENWKCSACGTELTHVELIDDEIEVAHVTHFDIRRSNKDLYIDNDTIQEDVEGSNLKMEIMLCENCMNKMIHESPTMKKLFLMTIQGNIRVIY